MYEELLVFIFLKEMILFGVEGYVGGEGKKGKGRKEEAPDIDPRCPNKIKENILTRRIVI